MQGMLMPMSVPGGTLVYYFVEAETDTDKEAPCTLSRTYTEKEAPHFVSLVVGSSWSSAMESSEHIL